MLVKTVLIFAWNEIRQKGVAAFSREELGEYQAIAR
jgi:hypothetical protein